VSQKYSGATYLRNTGIDVVIDTKPAIAYNCSVAAHCVWTGDIRQWTWYGAAAGFQCASTLAAAHCELL